MYAEIISIGDELLIGQVVNTNATWISKQLDGAGIRVLRHQTVRDSPEDITDAVNLARNSAKVIIMTGGLGPTNDDRTRDTLCRYYNDTLVRNDDVLKDITDYFAGRRLKITDRNVDQAMVPSKCMAIRNKNGTAPGFYFDEDDFILISMPGVPYEMKVMMEEFVIPELQKVNGGSIILHRNVMTIGIGESYLADRISVWEEKLPPELKLAYLPGAGMVRIRLTAYEATDETSRKMDTSIAELDDLLGEFIYSHRDESIEATVAQLLTERQQTLATAESCSGGFIASSITKIPGCSAWFLGGMVSYSGDVKVSCLGIDKGLIRSKGVVSEDVAIAMANGVRSRMRSDWSVSTTGIAGPDGGTDELPVGTVWVGIAGPHGTRAEKFHFTGNRSKNIELTKLFAINELRKEVLKVEI